MHQFNTNESAIIIAIIVAYIAFTSWLTLRLRSRNSAQFMVGSRAMPAVVISVLLMSEFIGAKSTVGTSQEAFNYDIAAAWSVIGAAIGFLLYGLFFVRRLYASGEFTISGAIEKKFGRSTKITVSVIIIYALLQVNVGNYVSGAAALSAALQVNLTVAMFIIAIVSTFYYVFGGLKGVAYVTVLHSAVKVIGRALMAGPRLLLLDEPSLGLAPLLVRCVFEKLAVVRQETGLAMILVEQNFRLMVRVAEAVHFMRGGRMLGRRDAAALREPAAMEEAIAA